MKTPEQKQASKARKNKLIVETLLVAVGLLQGKTGLADAHYAVGIHIQRLGEKKPQEKSLMLDVKIEVDAVLKAISTLKCSQQANAVKDVIARLSA